MPIHYVSPQMGYRGYAVPHQAMVFALPYGFALPPWDGVSAQNPYPEPVRTSRDATQRGPRREEGAHAPLTECQKAALPAIEQALGSAKAIQRYWTLPSLDQAQAQRRALAEQMVRAFSSSSGGGKLADAPRGIATAMRRGSRADRMTRVLEAGSTAALSFGTGGALAGSFATLGLLAGPAAPAVSVGIAAGVGVLTSPLVGALHLGVSRALQEGKKKGGVAAAMTALMPRGGGAGQLAADIAAYPLAFMPIPTLLQVPKIAVMAAGLTTASVIVGAVMGPLSLVLAPMASYLGGAAYAGILEGIRRRVWTGGADMITKDASGHLKLDPERFRKHVTELDRATTAQLVGKRWKAGHAQLRPDRLARWAWRACRENPRQFLANTAAVAAGGVVDAGVGLGIGLGGGAVHGYAPAIGQAAGSAAVLAGGWPLSRPPVPVAPSIGAQGR